MLTKSEKLYHCVLDNNKCIQCNSIPDQQISPFPIFSSFAQPVPQLPESAIMEDSFLNVHGFRDLQVTILHNLGFERVQV